MIVTLKVSKVEDSSEGREVEFELEDPSGRKRATIYCEAYAAHIASSLSKERVENVREEIRYVKMLGVGARVKFGR